MKAILISVHPQWVEKILNGIKKDEIRKGTAIGKAINRLIEEQGVAPTFIYCTKAQGLAQSIGTGKWLTLKERTNWSGKVVAQFNATAEEIKRDGKGYYYCDRYVVPYGLQRWSCLTQDELHAYLQGKIGTAIHINNLEIFDKPREISEFMFYKKFSEIDYMLPIPRKETCERLVALTKAPQSWCYIEI